MLVVKLTKCVCVLDPKQFAIRYFLLLVVLSLTFDYVTLPEGSFFERLDALNAYFAKYAVDYVVLALFAFVFFARYSLDPDNYVTLFSLLRILFDFCLYYPVRKEFEVLSFEFGACVDRPQLDGQYVECVQNGYTWRTAEASGSTYAVFYCLLIILEEVDHVFGVWQQADDLIATRDDKVDAVAFAEGADVCDDPDAFEDARSLAKLHVKCAPFVKFFFSLLGVLTILLHAANLFMVVYFRNFVEKMSGPTIAILHWLLTYQLVYKLYDSEIKFDKRRILEYFAFVEQNTEKSNLIEEAEFSNEVNSNESFLTKLWRGFFRKKYTYDDL